MKVLLCLMLTVTSALSLELNSGTTKVNLLELYTSESCSSCPPAEKFISEFRDSELLWKKIVPVSFHVAYWNHLSWKDKFSKKKYSARQRSSAKKIGSNVYTPQLLLNGVDIKNSKILSKIREDKIVGNLNVKLDEELTLANMKLNSSDIKDNRKYTCYGALLKSRQIRAITSGENSGKTLREDFIVIRDFDMKAEVSKHKASCELKISTKNLTDYSLAFWISDSATNNVVQAVGRGLKEYDCFAQVNCDIYR